jgi:hypothetical protein
MSAQSSHNSNLENRAINEPVIFLKLAVAFIADLLPILDGSDLKVFLAVAQHLNYKTHTANPGIELIAAESGLSEKTVIKSIKRLEQFDAWRVEREHRRSNIYHFNFLSNGSVEPHIPVGYKDLLPKDRVAKSSTLRVENISTQSAVLGGKNLYSNKNEEREEGSTLPILSSSKEGENLYGNDEIEETSEGLASTNVSSFKEKKLKSTKEKLYQLTTEEEEIITRLNEGLSINLNSRDKRVVEVAKFIAQEEENGRMLDDWLQWVNDDDRRQENAYKYVSFPQDIIGQWPRAFASSYLDGSWYNPQGLPLS